MYLHDKTTGLLISVPIFQLFWRFKKQFLLFGVAANLAAYTVSFVNNPPDIKQTIQQQFTTKHYVKRPPSCILPQGIIDLLTHR